jgi:hypothetical protein
VVRGFHPRFVLLVRDLLAEDVAAGRLETTVPLEDLAYTAVRVVESYVHRAAHHRRGTGRRPGRARAPSPPALTQRSDGRQHTEFPDMRGARQ